MYDLYSDLWRLRHCFKATFRHTCETIRLFIELFFHELS